MPKFTGVIDNSIIELQNYFNVVNEAPQGGAAVPRGGALTLDGGRKCSFFAGP